MGARSSSSRRTGRTALVAVVAVVVAGTGSGPAWAQTAPVAYDNTAYAVTGSATSVFLSAADDDGDPLTFAITSPPQHGTLTDDCGDGECTYTPDDGYTGADSIGFTASDGTSTSDPATVSVEVEEQPVTPTAYDGSLSTQKDLAVEAVLDATDPNGDPLTFAITTPPSHGALTGDCGDGTCTYTPEPGYGGEDSFLFSASDGTHTSNQAVVTVDVAKSPPVTRLQVAGAGSGRASLTWVKPVGVTGVVVRYAAGSAPATPTEGTGVPVSGAPSGVVVNGLTDGTEYAFSVFALNGPDVSEPESIGFTPFGCPDLRPALDAGPLVTGASWVSCSGADANGVVAPAIPYFPTTGAGMALLTSGDTGVATPPDDGSGEGENNGSGQRGAHDVSSYRVDLSVPSNGCLRFDYVFASEEYPEYVGDAFNDGFLAQLDQDDWRVDGRDIVAQGNFAQTSDGGYVSVNGPIFDTTKNTVRGPEDSNTGYDGASGVLTASTPVTAGAHSVYLSVFDAGDGVLDSAAFIDRMRLTPGTCDAGTTVNKAPVAVDDSATTPAGTQVDVNVLANDTDPEGQALKVTSSAPNAAHGTVSCTVGGCTYTPASGYTGTDSFDYAVSDGAGGSDTGTVTVTVTGGNRAPVATDDLLSTPEDTAGSVTVRTNDTDPDGDPLTVSGSGASAHGTYTCSGASCSYTPAADYAGPDTFDYTVSDGRGGTDQGTVTVTVTPVNDAPVAVTDSATTAEDTPTTIAVVSNDKDAEGSSLSAVVVATPGHGTVTCSGGSCTYTPTGNYHGPDSFTYKATDGSANSATTTVSITVTSVNDRPVAVDDSASVGAGGTVTVPVAANDTDVDTGDVLTVSGSGSSAHGTYTCSSTSCTYTAAAGWSGSDGFDYTVSDGHGGTDTGRVTVAVAAVNSPPAAKADAATTAEDTPQTVAVLANDTDADGNTLTVVSRTVPAHGSVTCSATACTYAPAADWNGTDSFTYTVSDGKATSSATVTMTATAVNDAPVAGDDAATTTAGQPAKVSVLANDKDADGDALVVTQSTQGAKGAVTCSSLGACTYTPGSGFVGTDSFTYTVSDGHGGTDTATVTVTVGAAACVPSKPVIGWASPGAKYGKLTAIARWKPGAPKACAAATTGYVVTAYKLSWSGAVLYTRTATAGPTAVSREMTLPSRSRWVFRVVATSSVGVSPASARSNMVSAR